MVEHLDSWIRTVGPWGYLALGLAALIEYVFPPFPGDSIVLLGGVFAARGERPWPLVLLVVTAGSVIGAAADVWVGRRVGPRLESRFPGIRTVEERMRRQGWVLLAFNRFMPGVRALIFVAAGAARLPLARVLGWGAFSALLFNGGMLALGFSLGGNAERLATLFTRYQEAAFALCTAAALGVVARALWIRQRPAH